MRYANTLRRIIVTVLLFGVLTGPAVSSAALSSTAAPAVASVATSMSPQCSAPFPCG